MKILLVEDTPINQAVTMELLKQDGHTVTLAKDGPEALTWAAKEPFDLMLLDIHLPGMSGLEVAARIRADAGLNVHTPMVALTANVQPSNVKKCHDAGIWAVIPKPFSRDVLHQVMRAQTTESMTLPVSNTTDELLDMALIRSHFTALGKQRLSHLVQSFERALDQGIDELQKMNVEKDHYELAEIAHRLAGDADAVGAQAVAQSLRTIEVLSSEGANRDYGQDITALLQVYQATSEAYQQIFESHSV